MGDRKALTWIGVIATFGIMFNPGLRSTLGQIAGYALDPVVGFHGQMPELTVLLVGSVTVIATTLIRHRTTDWLHVARQQRMVRSWQQQMQAARRAKQPGRVKALETNQADILAIQQEMQARQFRTMPLTMLVVVPCFAWMSRFIQNAPYHWYSSPWKTSVDLTETTVFPHWVLLYMCLSIPLGALVSKALKAWSWRNTHPTTTEVIE